MIRIKILLIVFSCLIVKESVSQKRYLDSLVNYVNISKEDTHKLSVLTIIIEAISEDAVWSIYNDLLGPLAKKLM